MDNIIGNFDNMKLKEKIVLNGIVDFIDTNDDNNYTIGIKNIIKQATLSGEELLIESNSFAFTKEMATKIGWSNVYASVRFLTGDTPIDPLKVEQIIIENYFGNVKSLYRHHYSDYTGYLWTDEDFVVGGHKIPKILENYNKKYIHMEIELYTEIKGN